MVQETFSYMKRRNSSPFQLNGLPCQLIHGLQSHNSVKGALLLSLESQNDFLLSHVTQLQQCGGCPSAARYVTVPKPVVVIQALINNQFFFQLTFPDGNNRSIDANAIDRFYHTQGSGIQSSIVWRYDNVLSIVSLFPGSNLIIWLKYVQMYYWIILVLSINANLSIIFCPCQSSKSIGRQVMANFPD